MQQPQGQSLAHFFNDIGGKRALGQRPLTRSFVPFAAAICNSRSTSTLAAGSARSLPDDAGNGRTLLRTEAGTVVRV